MSLSDRRRISSAVRLKTTFLSRQARPCFTGRAYAKGAEVRVNGIVHIRAVLPENSYVPIGWIALGNPVQMYPPDKHDEIWAVQRPLNFPAFVYGVERESEGQNMTMQNITDIMTRRLGSHLEDTILPE